MTDGARPMWPFSMRSGMTVFEVLWKEAMGRDYGLTVKEISKSTGLTEARVRGELNALRKEGRVHSERDSRPSYSANFRWMESGYHLVNVWSVSRSALISHIKEVAS